MDFPEPALRRVTVNFPEINNGGWHGLPSTLRPFAFAQLPAGVVAAAAFARLLLRVRTRFRLLRVGLAARRKAQTARARASCAGVWGYRAPVVRARVRSKFSAFREDCTKFERAAPRRPSRSPAQLMWRARAAMITSHCLRQSDKLGFRAAGLWNCVPLSPWALSRHRSAPREPHLCESIEPYHLRPSSQRGDERARRTHTERCESASFVSRGPGAS